MTTMDLRLWSGRGAEAAFVDDPLEWLVFVMLMHPAAIVEADEHGVLRGFVEGIRVAAFGRLRGLGCVYTSGVARDSARARPMFGKPRHRAAPIASGSRATENSADIDGTHLTLPPVNAPTVIAVPALLERSHGGN